MQHPEPLHPATAEELANSGGWQLGEIDFSEHLARYRDHEVVVITLYEPIPVGEK